MPLDELNNLPPPAIDWQPLDRSLLGDARFRPPPFPVHLLPGRWRTWIEASSAAFGAPDYLAHCLLGGVAGVASAGLRIEVAPHWREPLILWQALVGGPASGRTAAFARVRTLLDGVSPARPPLWGDDEDPDAEEEAEPDPELIALLRRAPRVLVDTGIERLSGAMHVGANGVVLWRESLSEWRGEAGAQTSWRAAWNGAPATIGYGGNDFFAAGLLGALSPDSLASFVARARPRRPGDAAEESSLASRFLYAWPQPALPATLAGAEADDAGLVALLRRIVLLAGDRENPSVVPVDQEGARWLERLMPQLRQLADDAALSGEDEVAGEWGARGTATIVRLAGVLSLMEWAETELAYLPIGAAHFEAAYSLWSGYYLPHAQAVFDRAGARAGDQAARRVVRWLRRVRAPQISREEVRREALCQSISADAAEEVLARLEAGGVVRPIEATGAAKGGPKRRRWEVNPALGGVSAVSASALASVP